MKYPFNFIKEGFICAEIGVWKGTGSKKILKRLRDLSNYRHVYPENSTPGQLHLIDPWFFGYIDSSPKSVGAKRMFDIPQSEIDQIYESVCNEFTDSPEVTIHRKASTKAKFSKGYFDWVYIDGDHRYDAVLADLEHYYPLVKTGGYICGDDYKWTCETDCPRGPGPAVDLFAEKYNLNLQIGHPRRSQFVMQKK